ncbi:hypothetical protein EE612_042965 [Oryza sativa]|nr:hypothetical protein EE612_042965 [Oryza sativa]
MHAARWTQVHNTNR